jgi:hypothetical protein
MVMVFDEGSISRFANHTRKARKFTTAIAADGGLALNRNFDILS